MNFEEMCATAIAHGNQPQQPKYVDTCRLCGGFEYSDRPHDGCVHTLRELSRMAQANSAKL